MVGSEEQRIRDGEAADGEAADEVASARRAAEMAAELSETDTPEDRRRMARAVGGVTRSAARTAGRGTRIALHGAGAAGRSFGSLVNWLTGQVMDMGPRLKVRDQAALRAQFPGRTDDEIARVLIDRAARASAAVGGATGVWGALPVLLAFPAEIAAETLSITGIEIKLVAELHEAYGMPATGTTTERGRAYIASWANRRGVYAVPGGLLLIGGSPLARLVRRRLAGRARRSVFSLAPLLTGALAGAMINSRETKKLGNEIREELRKSKPLSLPNAPD
jgi:hypothetical protein